jgi:ABC-type branched-subunit amino acid transport system permease subunit
MFLIMIVIQVIGGQGLFPGALVGAFVVTFASEYLRVAGTYRLVIFGAIIVVTCAVMPKGIMGILFPKNGGKKLLLANNLVQKIFPRRYAKKI